MAKGDISHLDVGYDPPVKIKIVDDGQGGYALSVASSDATPAGSGSYPKAGANSGYRAVMANADTDTVVAKPSGATGAVIYFMANGVSAEGRVGMNGSSSVITVNANNLSYQPASPEAYNVPAEVTHLHLAGLVANTTVGVAWLFPSAA